MRSRARLATAACALASVALASGSLAPGAGAGPCPSITPVISSPAAPVAPATETLVSGTVTINASYGGNPDGAVLRVLQGPTPTELTTAPLFRGDFTGGGVPLTGAFDTRTLTDGVYKLRVELTTGGCKDSADAPVKVDNTKPVLTIGSGPAEGASLASGTAISFGFSATDLNAPVSFRCAYDGADPAPCAAPTASATLSAGPHSFRLLGTDAAGNTALLTRSFSVELPPAAPAPAPSPDDQPKAKPRCRVPHLRGLTLAAATTKLRKAHCTLGSVSKPPRRVLALPFNRGQRLVVQRQSIAPGKLRSNGQPVGLALVPKRDLKLG